MVKKGTLGAILATALLTALVSGSAWAQSGDSQTLQLTPSRDSGVSGTATLTDVGGGVEVTLDLQGLPKDGVSHLAHIHAGATCADDRAGNGAPVEYPLETVVAQGDAGSSTTTIPDVTLAQLFDGTPRYVNVHAEKTGDDVPPGIACADLVATSGAGDNALAETGGLPVLPAAAVFAVLALTTGLLLIRRPA
jgi:hypothetical protein